MSDTPRLAAMMQLLAAAEASANAELIDLPHIVRVHDPEVGVVGDAFHGPYPGPVEAAEAAELIVAGLNRGVSGSDQPFSATIHPLLPAARQRDK